MRKENRIIVLDGQNCNVNLLIIEESDRNRLRELYSSWRNLTSGMQDFKSRGINLPEGLSESAFCLEYGSARVINVSGASGSFDTIDLVSGTRQQIKATSVQDDLTSFGPRSVWDDLFWLDFFREGDFDRTFDVYRIPDDLIYDHKLNANQTFRDQQQEGKRPRLHMRNGIIIPHDLQPERTCTI